MDNILRLAENGLRFIGVALLGCALSLALYQTWQLDTRWAGVVVIGIVAVVASMCMVRVFSDFLLIAILFCLPFATFTKWFIPGGGGYYAGGIRALSAGALGIGVTDFITAGLYISWFYRVFVTREQSPPRFNRIDFFILWFIVAHVLATIGSADPELGFGATVHLAKCTLFYFYLSRHFEERHLPWLVAAFLFIIVLEACLGSFQFATGRLVGLALDKGAGHEGTLNHQYAVSGTGGHARATGTSYDSHIYGHFLALILPFPLMLVFTPRLRPALRLGCMVACAGALLGILLSLSRSAWLSSAIALTIGIPLMIALWRERHMVPAVAVMVVLAALVTPFVASYVYGRFTGAPIETITERLDLDLIGLHVLSLFPVFGVGPANWVIALQRYSFLWQPTEGIHNVILWIVVEDGVFGLIPYLGILIVASWRLFSLARRRRDIAGRFALASLIAMMTTVLNGLTDPGFREPNVFLMFWLLVSFAIALPRLPPGAGAILMAAPQPARGLTAVPGLATGGPSGSSG